MKFDRAAIDKQRELQGIAPLTDEEFTKLTGGNNETPEEESARIKAEEEKNKNNPPAPNPPAPEKVQLTDDEIMKIVAEKTGRTLSSWDDLKPKQEEVDKEKLAEEREADKLAWGLKNKKILQKDYERFIATTSKDPVAVVREFRKQQEMKDDPNFDEKTFNEEFDEEFGLDEKPETRRYTKGQQVIKQLAKNILENSFSAIFNLESEYSAHEQNQKSLSAREQKIKQGAPAYKEAIDKVKDTMKKVKAKFSENEEYEADVMEASIDKVVSMMTDPEWAAGKILNGYTQEQLNDVAYTIILKENFPALALDFAKQYHLKHAKGVKGIPVGDRLESGGENVELSESAKVLKNLIEKDKQAATEPAAN